MQRIDVYVIALAFIVIACSKTDDKATDKKTPGKTAPSVKAPKKPEKKLVVAPRDPRIAKLFAEGKDCKWNERGMTKCAAAEKMRKLAFNEQSNDKLAASCMAALTDKEASTRGLAAKCMKGFNDGTRIPHMAAGLDAFEAEKQPELRVVIACAFSSGNARESGVEDRVIKLVRTLAADAKTESSAACLFDSMFPQYLLSKTAAPSKQAGDLALEYLKRTGWLQQRAFDAVGTMKNRAADVCAGLAEVVKTSDRWSWVVNKIVSFGDACAGQVELVVSRMTKAMAENKFNTMEYNAARTLLRRVPLSKPQVAKLAAASKKLAKKAKGVFKKGAKEIAKKFAKYKPPVTKKTK